MSWLVSPRVDLGSLAHPVLAFRTSVRYPDNSILEVFVSTNWSGAAEEISQATWMPLNAQIAKKTDNPAHWVDSGLLSLADYVSHCYIAFRYTGSGKTSHDGTYELDDIRIVDKEYEKSHR